jgi:DHA1 family tetracycline resistance protein-like MFS transporter
VYISVFIDVLGIGLVIPVLPYLILSFDNTGAAEVGLTIAAFSLCQIPGSIIFGAISDKYGRRPVLLLSIFSSAVSFLLCAFARDLPFIIAARCVSGLTGGSISVAQAYVADVTTVDERPRFLGLIGATIGIAFTFGPGIGAGVAAAMDAAGASIQQQYSGVFFLAAGFSFLGFAFACRNLEESSGAGGAEPAAVEGAGAVEVASGAAPAPARRSASRRAVAVPILLVALAMFASNYAFTVMQSTYGVLIFEEWGWSTGALGLILVLSGLEIAVLQGKLIKGLVDATGKHGASFLACLCLGGGLALLPYTLFSKPLRKCEAGARAQRRAERSEREEEGDGAVAALARQQQCATAAAGAAALPRRRRAESRAGEGRERHERAKTTRGSCFCSSAAEAGQNLGLSGGEPPNPPCGRRGRTCPLPPRACARPHTRMSHTEPN